MEIDSSKTEERARPRLKPINRQQLVMRPTDVEQLVVEDHEVRAIWEFVGRLDLGRYYEDMGVVEGEAGRPALDPRLMISLWIYGYSKGVSSGREISRLCDYDPAYQWLTGLEGVNHHSLSDFRVRHKEALDELFTQVLGLLSAEGLISLERVMHDGTKVKAYAGADTFRREQRVRAHLEVARQQVERMGDPRTAEEVSPRVARARERAVREKQQRLEEALRELEMLVIDKYWSGEKYRVGMNAFGGQKLGSLPDLTQMEAKLFVLESEASGLKENLPVSLSLDFEPGRIFTGKVIGIDTIAKPLGEESPLKYFETKVALDVTDPQLMKPGVQVKASIFVEKQADVLAVPNQALVFEQANAFLLVRNSTRVEKRAVETGARSLTLTVITKGLREGDAVLLGNPAPAQGGKST